MSCNIKKIKGCEIAGSTFNGRKISLNRDFSNDTFKAKVKTFNQKPIAEITGVKNATGVYFPFNGLENLSAGLFIIEYWGNFEDIGNELFCVEEFSVVAPSKAGEVQCCDNYNVFNFVTEDVSIDIQITATIVNIGGGGGDLSNYYTKDETYSKIEIDSLLGAIQVTKNELNVLISENKLEPNRLYKITGVESWCFSQHLIKAIYLKAISNNTLESEGVGEFYTPKYNELDDNLGIWKSELFANGMIDSLSYNIGDKVIWGNLFWENISGQIGTNIKEYYDSENDDYLYPELQNYLSETDWQIITPLNDESLYNINFNIIKYDLINDYIYYREDELNNKYELPYNVLLETFPTSWIIDFFPEFIHNVNSISLFQWGKSNVNNNFINNSIVFNCNYNTLYFKDNVILEKSIIEKNSLLGVNFIGNKLVQSLVNSNYIKTFGGIINNTLYDSEISDNRYYIEIINNRLSNNSQINNNNDINIIVNNKYTIIKDNILDNNCQINSNTFVEEGKEVDFNIKSIYGNELINNCSINNNTIKNGSKIFGHTLEYYSTINGNTLDTEANIYNNQLVQNGKIDNNILTGHGRIYGNQLDRISEITNCKLRISPATSYASGIHTNRLFTGKIQNIDFGNIVNPEGTNPNDPNFGGNEIGACIIENNSIIKDLTFPNTGNKRLQLVRLSGFSELKNITVNNKITGAEFINTVFNETSDYNKLIETEAYLGNGYTRFYIDNKLVTLSKLDETFLPYTGAKKNVNIGSYYFESALGFKKTNGTATQALTANGGVFDLNTKADLENGKIPATQLPSYVDDVLEFANLASFPATGESGKIYIAIDTNLTYRWGGSSYVVMSSSLALGETSSTAYRGDYGKVAYDHSQKTTGNPHGTTKADIGLGNVPNVDATNPANITQSANYRFFTDTERTKLNSITGINTGDETSSSIVTKLGYTPESNANKSTNINTDKSSDVKFPSVKAVYDWSTIELNKKVDIGLDTVFNFKNISAMTLTEFRSITPNLETIYFTEEQNGTGWQQIRYNGLGITIPATTETVVSLTDENFIELDSDSTFNLIDVANTKINGIFEKDFIIIKFNAGVVTPATANQWFKVILKINGVQTAVSPVFYLTESSGTVEQIAYDFSLNVTPEMVANGATLHLKTSTNLTFNNPAVSVARVHKSTNANL